MPFNIPQYWEQQPNSLVFIATVNKKQCLTTIKIPINKRDKNPPFFNYVSIEENFMDQDKPFTWENILGTMF